MKKLYYVKVIGKNEYIYKLYSSGDCKHTRKLKNAKMFYAGIIDKIDKNKYELIEIK